MPKYRVEIMVDVYSQHLYAEVEADSEHEAKTKALESAKEDIEAFVSGTVADAGWETDEEAVEEPDADAPEFVKDEWERLGDGIKDAD